MLAKEDKGKEKGLNKVKTTHFDRSVAENMLIYPLKIGQNGWFLAVKNSLKTELLTKG